MENSATIRWEQFTKIDIRAGTIVKVEPSLRATKPAYKIWVDLGELGIKKSSAQITHFYEVEELLGKQVVCVVNLPSKQVANFISEVLITGFVNEDGNVVLCTTDKNVINGSRLY